jgi:hypothetical protein
VTIGDAYTSGLERVLDGLSTLIDRTGKRP